MNDNRGHPIRHLPLSPLLRQRPARSRRASSYDRTGGNEDFLRIGPGETVTLLEQDGPGCVTHLYCAMVMPDLRDYRDGILRCYWDGSQTPSVQVPLGSFFGIAHARVQEFTSQLLVINPGMGTSHGLNAYFPMPFGNRARITLENRGNRSFGGTTGAFWFQIDYETYGEPLPDDVAFFHATYRQERPTTAVGSEPNAQFSAGSNVTGNENFEALDTIGAGRMVGLQLQIENLHGPVWYGEGDDMVFVDGESWPPWIHGTGTEEIFGGGASPSRAYAGPYTGFHLVDSPRYDGCVGMYRWYVHDPIQFTESLRWTIEHGHANNFANHYSSVAYWYQQPVTAADDLPDLATMLPTLDGYDDVWARLTDAAAEAQRTGTNREAIRAAGAALYRGRWNDAIAILDADTQA